MRDFLIQYNFSYFLLKMTFLLENPILDKLF